MPETQPCVLYARKSTDREDKQILSIPAQLDELRRFSRQQGLTVTEELVESCSAREPGRPVFSKLLSDVAKGKVRRILAWKLDRLARNPVDGGALIHYLGKDLLGEIVTPEGRYTGAGDSKFMLSVLFGAATKMTDDLSAGVRRGNEALHRRGRIPGKAPLGYIKVRENPGFRGAGRVEPDPERFETVKRVWTTVLAGEPVASVWRKATEEWGLKHRDTRKAPGRPPTVTCFYQLLRNRFYAGQIVGSGEIFQGEHAPMITPAEFEKVQRIIARGDAARPQRHDFLYRGFLHCGECSRLLTGELIKGKHIYYRCGRRRIGYPQCRPPAPTEAQVTASILHSLQAVTLPRELVDWTNETIDWWLQHEKTLGLEQTRAYEREFEQIGPQLKRLTDLVVAGTLTEGEYIERKAALLDRKAQLEAMIAKPLAAEAAWRDGISKVLENCTQFLGAFQNGDNDVRRGLLTELYANATVTNRITKPELRFPYSAIAEARPDSVLFKGADANYPSPRKMPLNQRKNARPRNARDRAFHAWCSKLYDVRTHLGLLGGKLGWKPDGDVRSSPCRGKQDDDTLPDAA